MLGIIRLSFPLIVLFNIYPVVLLNFIGQFLCSLVLGCFIYYQHWNQLKNLTNSLKYTPKEYHKNLFNNLIKECTLEPNDIVLRYAYTNEQIAMAANNTVIIDPIIWHNLNDDQEAIKVKDIFKEHIQPTLTYAQTERIDMIHNILNPAVQRFIFKHELGHVFYNYSNNSLIRNFIVIALATYNGIIASIALLPFNGFIAIIGGMIVASASDISLTYLSNAVWKLYEEKKADRFAIQYSSYEDIQEAAHFFKSHQDILDKYKEPDNLLANLPSFITTGHPDGKSRSEYLLQLAAKKQEKSYN